MVNRHDEQNEMNNTIIQLFNYSCNYISLFIEGSRLQSILFNANRFICAADVTLPDIME